MLNFRALINRFSDKEKQLFLELKVSWRFHETAWNFKFTKSRSNTILIINNEINADLNNTNKHIKKLPWFSKFYFQKHFSGCRYTGQEVFMVLVAILFMSTSCKFTLTNWSRSLGTFFMLVHLRWYQCKHLSQTINTSSSSIGWWQHAQCHSALSRFCFMTWKENKWENKVCLNLLWIFVGIRNMKIC